jgi:NADH:ubiquinone oxidoreductase subunit 2 (subunit N)
MASAVKGRTAVVRPPSHSKWRISTIGCRSRDVAAIGPYTANAWTLLIALIVSTGISAYVYLRVIGVVFKKPAGETAKVVRIAGAQDNPLSLSTPAVRFGVLAVLVIALVGILWLGILPAGVMDLLKVGF